MEDHRTVKAYAKVNLCLSVGAPLAEGPDAGLHPIASWMQCIDLYDEVTLSRLTDGSPTTCITSWVPDAPQVSPIDWAQEKDLSLRAHHALEAFSLTTHGVGLPVAIKVLKRIPVGGGLGGGSSDAAAVLLGLSELFQLDVTQEKLNEIAASLGSDVAFFADRGRAQAKAPRAALVGGLGGQIERVQGIDGELVLIVPPYGCPTGPVYKVFDDLLAIRQSQERAERAVRGNTGREKDMGPKGSLVQARHARMLSKGRLESDHLFNDLTVPAYRVEPRLGRLVTALSNTLRETVHVSGSGSCAFVPASPGKIERVIERAQRLVDSSTEFNGVALLRVALV